MLALTTTNVLFILNTHIVADKNEPTKKQQLGVMIHSAIVWVVLLGHVAAVNNGLARVPQLGWVSNFPHLMYVEIMSKSQIE